MLIPKFSLRLALVVVTALCCFFLVVSMAARGHDWAIAFSVAGGAAAIMGLIYAGLFFLAWLLTLVSATGGWMQGLVFSKSPEQAQSPFAADRLPPVLVSPPPDPMD